MMSVLDTSKWKYFKYHELFDIKKGKRLTKEDFTPGDTPFIGAIDSNNGYREFIGQEANHPGNVITVNYNGNGVGIAFYQPNPFWASDDVNVLYPKFQLNKYIALFFIPLIGKEIYRFNYGRKWETNRMNNSIIKLPVNHRGEPDFAFMQDFIKSKTATSIIEDGSIKLKAKSLLNNRIELSTSKWKEFKLTDIFEPKGSKTTPIQDLEEIGPGKYPFVTTQATNNGIAGYYNHYTEDGNVLTIDSAVVGYCSFQSNNFSASDHVEKLIPKFEMNRYIAMFLVTVINLENYRYNYGRKASQARLKKTKVKLPAKNGKPDFEFMENYIKSLPFSSSI